ncbi:MAG: molecular chaperone TorD family protein [Bacteroidetes bacterium]|nr:molecular chaperone TorD family protein [Candidatus Neomarinimicrobiota bacterium]MBL6964831.1 molecular chaperone TorD family protein [Bacteroidota bacterium]
MKTLTKQNHMLESRSTLYGAVSALFSDPESEKFAMLLTPKIQGCVLDACFQLEELENNQEITLSKSFQKLMAKLNISQIENIRSEFVDVFGHTLSKKIAPYALEHLKNSDVFFLTQKLADLNGFYQAFGMKVESIERADHISTQTEFISFLLLKELIAQKDELDEEKEVCEKAFYDFCHDHFSDWAKMFAGNLTEKVDGEFFRLAGIFLQGFLKSEVIYSSSFNKSENALLD